jgi:hypothetical protein
MFGAHGRYLILAGQRKRYAGQLQLARFGASSGPPLVAAKIGENKSQK